MPTLEQGTLIRSTLSILSFREKLIYLPSLEGPGVGSIFYSVSPPWEGLGVGSAFSYFPSLESGRGTFSNPPAKIIFTWRLESFSFSAISAPAVSSRKIIGLPSATA